MKYKYGTTHYDAYLNVQYSVDNGVLYRWFTTTKKWSQPSLFTLKEVLNDPDVRKIKQ